VIEKLNAAVRASLAKPEIRSRLETLGALPSPTTSAEFKTFVAAEADKFGKIIQQAGIKEE
jgi:tripartite-type tricarboxylate transporter receptor subunit TctC